MANPPLILEGAGLRLSFHRHGDRLAHTIGLIANGRLHPLLASVEGSGDDSWPPSPPLQTIDLQSRGESSLAMLVGMAGRSHWSLSVELSPAAGRLTFDAACRIKGWPKASPSPGPSLTGREVFEARIGSGYRSMVPPRVDPARGLILEIDGLSARVDLSDPPGAARLQVTGEGLAIVVEPGADPPPRTLRWSYVVTRIR